jgi:hypothetical protein
MNIHLYIHREPLYNGLVRPSIVTHRSFQTGSMLLFLMCLSSRWFGLLRGVMRDNRK